MAIPAITDTDLDERWRPHAACAQLGPDLFYGPDRARPGALCADCPVSEPCFWAAMALEATTGGHRYGIWGGTSPPQRARIAKSLGAGVDFHGWYQGVVEAWVAPDARATAGAA